MSTTTLPRVEQVIPDILNFIEMQFTDTQKQVQELVDQREEEAATKARGHIMTILKKLAGVMMTGLSFEESVELAQAVFVESQKKCTSKYAEPIAEKILKMQADYNQTKEEMKRKLALMQHDKKQ